MRRSEVNEALKSTEGELRRFGVASLYLFGSYAHDAADPQSDIDVFVDPGNDEDFGFEEFMGAYEALRRKFGPDVEIGYSTRAGISKYVRESIEREAIKIF
jgi:predicted nucleotidyltransferase